jgi:hypothetical protein
MVDRGKKIKVFISGDYEFETRSYGISGASGNKTILIIINLNRV